MNKDPKEGAAKMPHPLCMSNPVCYALSCAELVSDILPFLLLYSAALFCCFYSAAFILLLYFSLFCCSVFLLYRIAEYLYAGLDSQLAAV